jgi:hypothetical protein
MSQNRDFEIPPSRGLGPLDVVVLFVGAILALIPLIGLALNYSPFGITRSSALASLLLLLVVLSLTVIVSRRRVKAEDLSRGRSWDRLRSVLYATLPVAIAILLRTYPYLVSGLPFSVDSWPSIRYTELLLGEQPIRVGEAGPLGKSPDYFGEKVFGAVVFALTGLQPVYAMAFFVPVAGAFSILVFYALVDGLYGRGVSLMASLFLATAFSDVILTAGVKGETYAHPLYLLLILLFLNQRLGWWKKTLLFTVTSASLVLTHYYTAILTAAILASMGLGTIIIKARKGASLEIRNLTFPVILAVSILMYFSLYANWAFNFISAIDWLSAASYQAILFSLTLWLTLKPQTQNQARTAFTYSIISVAVLVFAWLATRRPLIPGAPILPEHYMLYAGPFMTAAPLCVFGYGIIKENALRRARHAAFLACNRPRT